MRTAIRTPKFPAIGGIWAYMDIKDNGAIKDTYRTIKDTYRPTTPPMDGLN